MNTNYTTDSSSQATLITNEPVVLKHKASGINWAFGRKKKSYVLKDDWRKRSETRTFTLILQIRKYFSEFLAMSTKIATYNFFFFFFVFFISISISVTSYR